MADPILAGDGDGRSYWRWGKGDFFPEQSFQNWSSYTSALSRTIPRLRDRVTSRSTGEDEIARRNQSEHALRRCLTWWDLTWLAVGAVVGSGIFVLTGLEAHVHAGPGIVVAYAAAGFSALLSVFCYTEFAIEIPVAGGSFSYLRVYLGDFVAFIAAGNIILESLVGAAGLGRAWTSYFATLINQEPDTLRIHVPALADGYNKLDPIAVAVLIIISSIAACSTRGTSILNWTTSVVSTVLIAFITIAGFVKGSSSNLTPFVPYGAKGIFQAAAVVYWSYTGFDNVATLAEETKNPPKDIPIGLVGSMSIITIVYCLMSLSLCMLQSYKNLDVDAAFSLAFVAVGMDWAKYIVALGALKGMTTAMLVGSLGQARYTTHIARSHMIPPFFALVHPKTRTPLYATMLVTIPGAILAFFTSLDVLATVCSISTLFIFMLMAVALLVKRYNLRDVTTRSANLKLAGFLTVIILSSIAITVLWNVGVGGWVGYAIAVVFWFLATLGIVLTGEKMKPNSWGVPLVPWLPSLSIATNLFLMGSLGYQTFVRFGFCTLVMLAYYVLFGVHATFDVAQEKKDALMHL